MENKMIYIYRYTLCFSGGAVVKTPPANAGNAGLIPGSGRSPGVGNDNPLQNSCLENPMDSGAWQVTVHGVAKSQTPLSMHACTDKHDNPLKYLKITIILLLISLSLTQT